MKKMRQFSKYIPLYMVPMMLFITVTTIYNNSNVNINNASALAYSNNIDLEYTFNTTLDISFNTNAGFIIDNLAPGTSAYSNTVTVTASSNNMDGFTMSATAGNGSDADRNNNKLVNDNNVDYFDSVAPDADVALEGLGDDKWGYAIYDSNSSTWSKYHGLPAVGSAGTTLASLDGAGSTSVDMRIGASSTSTQASGTFTNNVNFTITANVVTYHYSISYDANTADTVSGLPSNVNGSLDTGDTLKTNATEPTRAKYTFLGWCDGTVADLTCDGNTYQANDYIKIANASSSSTNNITLKAIWGLRLYDEVASMTKGTQTIADVRTSIDEPDETEMISTNSGVYTYDASSFGSSSDASNDYPIYYYRGILDRYGHTGTYGSDGLADAYPNYVKLSNNTCWRIIRTTGSGGVKMIYNGTYGATTADSCANPTESANATSAYFNRGTPSTDTNYYGTLGFIAYWGYNYNPDYAYNHTDLTDPIDNSILFTNNTLSNIRTAVENWYSSNMTAYTDMLEGSAGYCNDRTTYTGTSLSSQTTSNAPYATSELHPGAYMRNAVAGHTPSYNCPNPTGYDLLTVGDGLGYPVALITADEAALAGSGWSNNGTTTSYHANSFLRSGSYFWSLSPGFRYSNGHVGVFLVNSNGSLSRTGVDYSVNKVRPVISLTTGTLVTSGSGIATDPWAIRE